MIYVPIVKVLMAFHHVLQLPLIPQIAIQIVNQNILVVELLNVIIVDQIQGIIPLIHMENA